MSFTPDSAENEATVNDLLLDQNKLLAAIVILLCEQNDEDPKQILEAAEKII